MSYIAMQWSIVAYVLMDTLQVRISSDWLVALGMTILDILVLVTFTWVLLRLTTKPARLVQTLTALCGTGTVLGVVALPLTIQAASIDEGDAVPGLLVLGWLLMLVWSIAVQANIFRHALSSAYRIGLLAAGLHTVLIITLVEMLFPRVAG